MATALIVRCRAVLLVLVLSSGGCTGSDVHPEPRLPEYLGSLKLRSVLSGVKANKLMYRMHGKRIGSGSSIIGYYGSGDADNVLYVSMFDSSEHAEKALEKMVSKMADSSGAFTPVEKDSSGNVDVFTTRGMGCIHYFYREKTVVIWLQADPGIAADTYRHAQSFRFAGS